MTVTADIVDRSTAAIADSPRSDIAVPDSLGRTVVVGSNRRLDMVSTVHFAKLRRCTEVDNLVGAGMRFGLEEVCMVENRKVLIAVSKVSMVSKVASKWGVREEHFVVVSKPDVQEEVLVPVETVVMG